MAFVVATHSDEALALWSVPEDSLGDTGFCTWKVLDLEGYESEVG